MRGGAAFFGKLPQKGDFLTQGMPDALLRRFEAWLPPALSHAKFAMGADWASQYEAAPLWRFWIGEGVLGAPVAGVLAFSADKVGRRYPAIVLFAAETGAALPPPPTVDPAEGFYGACSRALAGLRDAQDLGAALDQLSALNPLGADLSAAHLPDPRAYWAASEDSDPQVILRDVARAEARIQAAGRSYWWSPGDGRHVGAFHAADGLPEGDDFTWLVRPLALTGAGRAALEAEAQGAEVLEAEAQESAEGGGPRDEAPQSDPHQEDDAAASDVVVLGFDASDGEEPDNTPAPMSQEPAREPGPEPAPAAPADIWEVGDASPFDLPGGAPGADSPLDLPPDFAARAERPAPPDAGETAPEDDDQSDHESPFG